MKSIACAALAAVMACGLGGVERAEAAILSFYAGGPGTGSIDITSADPFVRPVSTTATYASVALAFGLEVGATVFESGRGHIVDGRSFFGTYYDDFKPGDTAFHAGYYDSSPNFVDVGYSVVNYTLYDLKTRSEPSSSGSTVNILSGEGFLSIYNHFGYYSYDQDFNQIVTYTDSYADFTFDNVRGGFDLTIAYVPLPHSASLFGATLIILGSVGYVRRRGATSKL